MITRMIIAGSRNFDDYKFLKKKCDRIIHNSNPQSTFEIISGGCKGADRLGELYARNHCYPLKIFPADWNKHGKAAGPIRNRGMAAYASQADKGILVAFPVGESKGTRNMISAAEFYGLEVYVFDQE